MSVMVHPTAVVSPHAHLEEGVVVGPWSVIDDHVYIGADTVLESRVRLYPGTTLGRACHLFDGAILGADPQDLKYRGEPTQVLVGNHTLIREYCTVNRGTGDGGVTQIGSQVLLMAYSHVAHDCQIGDFAVLANRVQLGGHVQIGHGAVLGGGVYVQQCCRIGAYAFIAGTQKVERHVPPASRALGNPLCWTGVNLHALRRFGFNQQACSDLQKQYRKLYGGDLPLAKRIETMLTQKMFHPVLADFFQACRENLIPRAHSGLQNPEN